jgi:hypothetical protein
MLHSFVSLSDAVATDDGFTAILGGSKAKGNSPRMAFDALAAAVAKGLSVKVIVNVIYFWLNTAWHGLILHFYKDN